MFWIALLLGLVEGLTEFLPISSTGHLILVSTALGFEGPRAQVFEIFIQLGAILSVVWEYRARLVRLVLDIPTSVRARVFPVRLLLAFLPSALLGLAVHDFVFERLFNPTTVAAALIVGAIMILIVEGLHLRVETREAESVTVTQAIGIGFAQCLALWPGFSRSAATILGGLTMRLDRRSATEFSFFLAIPTMFAAASYKLLKSREWLEPGDAVWLGLSFAVSFLVAWGSIRWLLHYISNHSFTAFAWYRLILGVTILLVMRAA